MPELTPVEVLNPEAAARLSAMARQNPQNGQSARPNYPIRLNLNPPISHSSRSRQCGLCALENIGWTAFIAVLILSALIVGLVWGLSALGG